jgi:AmmeMemoRadiSam system protein A
MPLPEASARRLLDIARASIRHGLAAGHALPVDVAAEAAELRELRATFVTLEIAGRLRGCIGTLEARAPLAQDVADHACAAAFEDSRFAPLQAHELDQLEIHISILTPATPLPCRDEADLLARLRPGVDGLILQEGRRRATFLPSVWEDLPAPADFLAHLKLKAGLEADYWSEELRFWRYETEKMGPGR